MVLGRGYYSGLKSTPIINHIELALPSLLVPKLLKVGSNGVLRVNRGEERVDEEGDLPEPSPESPSFEDQGLEGAEI